MSKKLYAVVLVGALVASSVSAKTVNVFDSLATQLGSREAMYACVSTENAVNEKNTFTNVVNGIRRTTDGSDDWQVGVGVSLVLKIPAAIADADLPAVRSIRVLRSIANSANAHYQLPTGMTLFTRADDSEDWVEVATVSQIGHCYNINQSDPEPLMTTAWQLPQTLKARQYRLRFDTANVLAKILIQEVMLIADDGTVGNIVRVAPGGTGDGSSWATPADFKTAITSAQRGDEVWLKEGLYTLDADGFSLSSAFGIYGGFAGDETTRADRHGTEQSVFDATAAAYAFTLTDMEPDLWHFENIAITNAIRVALRLGTDKYDGVEPNTSTAEISLKNCTFFRNGWLTKSDGAGMDFCGRGCRLISVNGGLVEVDNCVFDRQLDNCGGANYSSAGNGIYLYYGDVRIRNTKFLHNGDQGRNTYMDGRDYYSFGAGIHVRRCSDLLVTNCVFFGNRKVSNGSTSSGGSAVGIRDGFVWRTPYRFVNCLFAANGSWGFYSVGNWHGAAFYFYGENLTTEIEFDRCTFAHNYGPGAGAFALLGGKVKVRNSIIFGNFHNVNVTGAGDAYLGSASASLDIDYSLVSGSSADYLLAAAGTITLGENNVYGDPLFKTDFATVKAALYPKSVTDTTYNGYPTYFDSTYTYETADFHVTDKTSPAIDIGDPTASVGAEPDPNGSRLNAGYYAGTAEAAKSPGGKLAIESGDVTFAEGSTKPTVSVSLATDPDTFTATAYLCYGTEKSSESGRAGWANVMTVTNNLAPGDSFSKTVSHYLASGERYYWRIVVETKNQVATVDGPADGVLITNPNPALWGRGLGDEYVHVRAGADGAADGSDWLNACPTYGEALALVSGDRTNVAVAVDTPHFGGIPPQIATAITVRGGFAGSENTLAERPAEGLSVIDGDNLTGCNAITASSGSSFFERLEFYNLRQRAICVTGAGSLRVENCRFIKCGQLSGALDGRAVYASSASRVDITNCVFQMNVNTGTDQYSASATGALYLYGVGRAAIHDVQFATNGTKLATGSTSVFHRDAANVCSVYVNNTPVEFVGCSFVDCTWPRNNAERGVVCLRGNGRAGLTNCVFKGCNGANYNTAGTGGERSGCLLVRFSAPTVTVDLERCTFAYNYVDSGNSVALTVANGIANVHNCLFYDNRQGPSLEKLYSSISGRDLYAYKSSAAEYGKINVSYTLLDGQAAPYAYSRNDVDDESLITFGEGMTVADPKFYTPVTELQRVIVTNGYPIASVEGLYQEYLKSPRPNYNVHVRGCRGHLDEFTLEQVKSDRSVGESPAIDAGDPATDCSREPYNGPRSKARVNLGVYGNTPYATANFYRYGMMIFLR